MNIIVTHPTGNANVRAVLRALSNAGLLESFWTTLALPNAVVNGALVGERISRELSRRTFGEVRWEQTRARPWRELVRLASTRLGIDWVTRHETGWASVDAVYRDLDRAVARNLATRRLNGIRAIYAYEDGALQSFRQAADLGLGRIYDLPIAHWRTLRRLLEEESALHPEWAVTMEGLRDSLAKRERKDQEISLADRIVVPSSFVRLSVEEYLGNGVKIVVAPFGAPRLGVHRPIERPKGEPLRLIFVGQLNQRKGVAYLIDALQELEIPWHLTLAGRLPSFIPKSLASLLDDKRCHWLGHVPHSTLLEYMRRAHLFVFPSIVEGLALVLFEAMSSGLPIVATPNSGAPDIMTDGKEGFIVPIRNPRVIAERITELYEDEVRRQTMATAAIRRAATSDWKSYENQIAELVGDVIAQ